MSVIVITEKKLDTRASVKGLIRYIAGNKTWAGMDYTKTANCCFAYGLISRDSNVEACVEKLTREIMMDHGAFGFKGHRYGYHIILDFNGEVPSPIVAGAVGIEAASWFNQFFLTWILGVHLTKDKPQLHLCPHCHLFLSTQVMAGPNVGRKFCLGLMELEQLKLYTNEVLKKYGISEIQMTHLLGGKENENVK